MYTFYKNIELVQDVFINTESPASAIYFREFAFLKIMVSKILAHLDHKRFGYLPKQNAKKFGQIGLEMIKNVPKTFSNQFIARPLLQVRTLIINS